MLALLCVCIILGANDLHVVQSIPLPPRHLLLLKNRNGFAFLVLAYPGCPGKEAVKWVFLTQFGHG